MRLQVDNSNSWNVKRTNQQLIKAICNIRETRKQKISVYLSNYLQMIAENFGGDQSQDFRHKEALMHAFGLLSYHMVHSEEY